MVLERGDIGQVINAKQLNEKVLLKQPNVVAVGVGYKITDEGPTDELAVVVNVQQKLPLAQLKESDLIPRYVDDVKTDVVETGLIRAFSAHQERHRPLIPAGVSLGHIEVTSGTLGCLVKRGETVFVLSNNHVLANSNRGQRGDAIIQPSAYDNGGEADKVATLDSYVPLDFGDSPPGCQLSEQAGQLLSAAARFVGSTEQPSPVDVSPALNEVDAALARPLNPAMFSPDIVDIGRPVGARAVDLGSNVKKSGRTTGYTEGRIIQIDVTTSVMYGQKPTMFRGQLMANGMSQPGDSGAAILDEDNYVVGLLFAGSETTTLINPINPVLSALQVEIFS